MNENDDAQVLLIARRAARKVAGADPWLAEDIASTVLLAYYSNPPLELSITWARRVAQNAMIDLHRKEQRYGEISGQLQALFGHAWSPSMHLSAADFLTRLLAPLSPVERRVLLLRTLHDLSAREVAAEVGMTEHEVNRMVSDVRRRLSPQRDMWNAMPDVFVGAPLSA